MTAADELLLDFARDAHNLRVHGYSETQISRAAGIPERRTAHPNDIVERLARKPLTEIPDEMRVAMLVTVNQVLAYASDPRECHCPKTD